MNYAVPCSQHPKGAVTLSVPGSKSITNRALLLAVLAEGTSTLSGIQRSEDSAHFLSCVKALGYAVEDLDETTVRVTGSAAVPNSTAKLYAGSAGTAARFLTAMLGVSKGNYRLDSSPQMAKRPMQPLLDSLCALGTRVEYHGAAGHFPFTISGDGVTGHRVSVNIDVSSQFLSGLLISAVRFDGLYVDITGTHGMAYIDMTTSMMQSFGVCTERTDTGYFVPAQRYIPQTYAVEPDLSAACYFYALAALLGVSITVRGVRRDALQGDKAFLDVLSRMGAKVTDTPAGVQVTGTGVLHGVEVDMSAFSDQALTLAAIASYADTPTIIRGIGHIRRQECDRIHAIEAELTRLGGRVEAKEDSVTIYPARLHGGTVETYQDHRVAMSFALTGLRTPGVVISNAECCAKTFSNYFETLNEVLNRL